MDDTTTSIPDSQDPDNSGFISIVALVNNEGNDDIEWIPVLGIDGLAGRGLFTLLSARPKAGKTVFLAHCAKAWLEMGLRIAWLTEEPRAVWKKRGIELGLLNPNLVLGFQDGSEPEAWCARIEAQVPDIIIVDTARTFLGVHDENDSALVHTKLFPFMSLARNLNAVLWVVHHRRKADGDEGTDHAGSHAYVGECDMAISLREDTGRRRQLHIRSRMDESPNKLLIELSADNIYTVLGRPDAVVLEEVKRRAVAILTNDWQTTTQILEAFGLPRPSREQLRRALREMPIERIEGHGTIPDQWRL